MKKNEFGLFDVRVSLNWRLSLKINFLSFFSTESLSSLLQTSSIFGAFSWNFFFSVFVALLLFLFLCCWLFLFPDPTFSQPPETEPEPETDEDILLASRRGESLCSALSSVHSLPFPVHVIDSARDVLRKNETADYRERGKGDQEEERECTKGERR